jgi:hypothetical protein
MMNTSHFTTMRLLASVALIAVGVGVVVWWWGYALRPLPENAPRPSQWFRVMLFTMWLAGGAMIGAGLLAPFRLATAGIVVGLFIQFSILFLLHLSATVAR